MFYSKNYVQVNLCQKLFFLENIGRTCCVQKLFWVSKTISVHNMFCPCSELGIFMYQTCNSMNNLSSYCGNSWCKNKSFWQRFTCNELLLLLEETLVEWFELELEELDKRGGGEEPILGGATTPTSLARLFSSEEWTLLGFVLKILSWDSDLMTSLFCSKWVWLGDSKWAWLAGGVGGASKRLQSGGDWTPPSLLLSSSILYFDGNSIGFPVK